MPWQALLIMGGYSNGYVRRAWEWQTRVMSQLVERGTDLLFPPRCALSGAPILTHGAMDAGVWARLDHLTAPWCEACGLPFADEMGQAPLCVSCAAPSLKAGRLTGRGGLNRLRAAVAYSDAIAPAILGLKYGDRQDGVGAMARMMVRAGGDILSAEDDAPILVPIPLHRRRLLRRRYNQAGCLSAAIARQTGLAHDPLMLRRIKPTPSQRDESREARARNVAGAFAVRQPTDVEGRTVILVDDVLTTGATLLAAARPLRKAGAYRVHALVLARVVTAYESRLYASIDDVTLKKDPA